MDTKTDWKRKVEEYKNSGMSLRAWCISQGISQSTFRFHVKKSTPPKFAELKSASSGIKIRWKNLCFEIDPDFDQTTLSRFLQVLR